jgi:peptidoglycan-N-acetylglucosamine deacetylase
MLRPAVSRFHVTLGIALLLAAAALALGNIQISIAIVVAFLVVTGFGVAIPQMRFFGPFICRAKAAKRCVALTFDDGPDLHSTPALLDFLREAKVDAAFFCVGRRVAANPELAARIVREGHLIENHSYAHSNGTNFFTEARLKEDLTQAQTTIQQATGITPKMFRPPIGLSNPRIFRVARTLGLSVIGWSAGGLDTQITDPHRIVLRLTRRLHPGAVILLHDGGIPAQRLVATVKLLLDTLHSLGYEVVRLDRLLA